MAGHAGDIDDAATTLPLHQRNDRLHAIHYSEQISIEQAPALGG